MSATKQQHSRVIQELRDGQLQVQWLKGDGAVLLQLPPTTATSSRRPSGLKQMFLAAFMPEGWPAAVTPDYTGFVLWNTVQAISSYVRGVLSSHAVFKGVGVGDQAATALGAVFQVS